MYQEEDQQILRMSTYRSPEILTRLVSVQQDVSQAEKQTIKKFVNTPRRTPRLHLQVTCCLEHLSAEGVTVGPSLVPRPSLRETTSGLPILCCCCNTKCSWSSSGIKTVFIEPSILFESSVLPDMVSGVG